MRRLVEVECLARDQGLFKMPHGRMGPVIDANDVEVPSGSIVENHIDGVFKVTTDHALPLRMLA